MGPLYWPNQPGVEIEGRHLVGNALEVLRALPDNSVQMCVTSPPYWGKRSYHSGDFADEIGLEPTPDEYLSKLVAVFGEVRRVLKEDGTCWINIGDTHATPAPGNRVSRKDRALGALHSAPRTDGRYLNTITSGLKLSDLAGIPAKLAELLRLSGWFYRLDIIWHKQQHLPESVKSRPTLAHEYILLLSKTGKYKYNKKLCPEGYSSVWSFPTERVKKQHTAVFPAELPRRCILLGSDPGDVVLDPFHGSGTTGTVAAQLGRSWLGIDLVDLGAPVVTSPQPAAAEDPPTLLEELLGSMV